MENTNNPIDLKVQDAITSRIARLERLAELSKLTGLPAGNYSPPTKPEPLPLPSADWDLWAHMPKATLAEAVAVSLGIDPSTLKPGHGYAEPGKEFHRRLKLACAHVNDAGPLRPLGPLGHDHLFGGPIAAVVSLPEFGEWVSSMGWPLPERFPRMKTAPTKAAISPTAPATKFPQYGAVQALVKSELQKLYPRPVVVPEPRPATVVTPEPPLMPVVAESANDAPDGKVWTDERKAEARAYREKHGLKKTAEHYRVSQATISKHIPAKKGKAKLLGPWEGLGKK